MSNDERTAIGVGMTPVTSLKRTILLDASRAGVAGALLAGVFAIVFWLGATGTVGVASASTVSSLFSAIITGIFTLVSVVLAINQIVLSRVFGSPGSLSDRMAGTIEFRDRLEASAGEPTTPTSPGEFIRLVVMTIDDYAEELDETAGDGEAREDLDGFIDELTTYTDNVSEQFDEHEFGTFGVLSTILYDNYSRNIHRGRALRGRHGGTLGDAAGDALDEIIELLRILGVARQYVKTLYIQQALARLSRRLLYLGVPALLTATLTMLYYARSVPPTKGTWLVALVALAVTISVSPLAILTATVLRLATIATLTTSVGPFTPKEESTQ